MHVPDGFFNAATSVGAGAVAAGTIGVGLRKAADDLDDRLAPMAGLTAAFIFAAQMINFPVASGTSGHLLGGALAAVLLGPWAGSLCVAIVLVVQGVLFADGGLTALGLNVILIAIVPAFAGVAVYKAARNVTPANGSGVGLAAGLGAFVSVPVAAATFSLLFAVGGNVDLSLGAVLSAMVGVHILVGIGEGLVTAAVITAVATTRPDLVHGARDLEPTLTSSAVTA